MLRSFGSITIAICLGSVSYAQSGNVTLQDCLAIEDDAQRLACFDSVARAAPAVPVVEPAPSVAPSPVPGETPQVTASGVPAPVVSSAPAPAVAPPPAPTTQAAVQARPAPPPRPKAAPRAEREDFNYVATVVQTDRDPFGKLLVKFSNGEIWKQASRGRAVEPKIGSSADVRQSFSGAWFIDFESTRDTVRMVTVKYSD